MGDADKPKFVFFFDEAHLLFNGMPTELLDKMVQVVKLIRSKGVGVYFITQSPSDIPDEVLAQLSNQQRPTRLHPRRAEGRARCRRVLPREPGVRLRGRHPQARHRRGALVSFLDAEGRPSIVENAKVLPPGNA